MGQGREGEALTQGMYDGSTVGLIFNPTDKDKEAPMAELPGELEDMVGDLMEQEEDLFDEMEDVSSSAAESAAESSEILGSAAFVGYRWTRPLSLPEARARALEGSTGERADT